MAKKRTTNGFPKRAIHLDFHTMPGVYDVGRDFSAEEFAGTLKKAGVDYITVFARCNLGFAYYPTKVGLVHPGMKTADLLGPMVSACHKRGIKVAAYINAGIDHEHALRHREWCKVNKEGQVYEIHPDMSHWFRNLCLNTGYRQHLSDMVREVLEKYPVDGIFLDCFTFNPCYGVECLDSMKKESLDINDDAQVRAFCRRLTYDFAEEITGQINRVRPGVKILFNGLPYRRQPTHVEIEVLPTGGWGYDYLPWVIRYARTLGKPFFTMTGRFHKDWGDFGGLRPEHSLLFDLYYSLANAGTCSIGDHMHPRAKLEPAVYNLIGQVYRRTKELDEWTEGARAESEIAVVNPAFRDFPGDVRTAGVAGAARMLSELKYQFDVSDGGGDLSGYKIIVLPDDVPVEGMLKEKLTKHLKGGGFLISSGFSGLNPEKTAFALNEYRLIYLGPEPYHFSFFQAGPEVNCGLPDMLTAIYNPGIAMQAKGKAKVLARLYQPYFNYQSWDFYHKNVYIPPEKDTGRPALARCGNIFHFSFPVFNGYFEHAVPAYKYLLRNCLEAILPEPLVRTSGLPSFGQVTVTRQAARTMVHLLTYLPELRGKQQIIEEPIPIRSVTLRLRTGSRKAKKVYLAPSRKELAVQYRDGYAEVVVPEVNGYQMVVFE